MKYLITYLRTMNVEDEVNRRLDMIAQDGSPGIYTCSIILPNTETKSSNMLSSNWM